MRIDVQSETCMKGWTLGEMVEETRGKLHVKERDANAFYESSEIKKLQYEELIMRLRKENKEKRVAVPRHICGDEKVIRTVFHHRKAELLSMQRFTSMKSIQVMDQKVCKIKKRLNEIKHETASREEKLEHLNSELDHMRDVNTRDFYDEDREMDIRKIQNEIDKAIIKVSAARNITRRYEAIKDGIQEEVRNFPTLLDVLEKKLKVSTAELTDLKKMNEKAIKASEDTRRDLHTMEREMYQAKRARDQQLNEMRKEVEKRKETADKAEKKHRAALSSDTSDSPQAKLQMQKLERQEKILTLEDAFEKIKRATHVSDMEEIAYRVTHQDNTYRQLRSMEKEKMSKKNKVTKELAKLGTVFEEMKFTSERHIKQGRKALEDMAEYTREMEAACKAAVDQYTRNNKLFIDLQSGIATLLEKLKEVRLKPPHHNFAKGHPVEDLAQCGLKLNLLLTNLNMKKNLPANIVKVDNEKLHQYLETKLQPDNIRIRIDSSDPSDSDEFLFDHDQENEGFTSRDDIKRQGQEILNSKLKPKKKTRKRKN